MSQRSCNSSVDERALLDQIQGRWFDPSERRRCPRRLEQRHYLGALRPVGERLYYVATNAQGQWLTLLVFSNAAKHLKPRDHWIGWTPQQRERRRALSPAAGSRYLGALMGLTHEYLEHCRGLADGVARQAAAIDTAADWFAETILRGRMVHLFGSGHSRILVEEMWPRYGSFPGFNPIVELSLSFHNLVVGANGQRQAMFLENVSGLAERILRNYVLSAEDSALVISSSGCSVAPTEMAEGFHRRGLRVVAIVSREHAEASSSRRADGRKLMDFADLVLDTGAPVGDAMVRVPGLEIPVAPGSTVGGCMLINCLKAAVAARLTQAGRPPRVLTAAAVIGGERATELFEAAYDEHARRLARLYAHPEPESDPSGS